MLLVYAEPVAEREVLGFVGSRGFGTADQLALADAVTVLNGSEPQSRAGAGPRAILDAKLVVEAAGIANQLRLHVQPVEKHLATGLGITAKAQQGLHVIEVIGQVGVGEGVKRVPPRLWHDDAAPQVPFAHPRFGGCQQLITYSALAAAVGKEADYADLVLLPLVGRLAANMDEPVAT